MKKVKIDYQKLLFLYGYLRMIDLSLDRSRWNLWIELKVYFKNTVTPAEVALYLLNSFGLSKVDSEDFTFLPVKKSNINKLKPILFKTFTLSEEEVLYCCKLLFNFKDILDSDKKSYDIEIEKLRQDIALYYNGVLGAMILWKDLDKLMRIAHFLQHDDLIVLELNEFIPGDFPIK